MRKIRKLSLVFVFFISAFLLSQKGALASDPAPLVESFEAYQTRDGKSCNFFNGCMQAGEDVTINLSGLAFNNGTPFPEGSDVKVRLIASSNCAAIGSDWPLAGYASAKYSGGQVSFTAPGGEINAGCTYKLEVHLSNDATDDPNGWNGTPNNTKVVGTSSMAQLSCPADECNTDMSVAATYDLCMQIKEGTEEYTQCVACFGNEGIWTAIGCIPSKPEDIIKVVITIGLGLGGGIVLIMIIAGAFMLSTSQGDPNKTKEAKELITSAIIGLLFVIFSVTILQFIGVSILHIPGFGE